MWINFAAFIKNVQMTIVGKLARTFSAISSTPAQWRTQVIFMGRFHSEVHGGHLSLVCAVCDFTI